MKDNSYSPFSSLYGNEAAKVYLTRMLNTGLTGNLLLFAGHKGVGKGLFAEAFAKALIGTKKSHPDIRVFYPEGKLAMHSIETIRRLITELSQPPFEAKRGVFIIHEAERMLPTSSNALLKSFEEPHPDHVIILLCSHREALLPTIISRCRTLYFKPATEEEIASWLQHHCQKNPQEAEEIAALAQGSFSKAEQQLSQEAKSQRELLIQILSHGKFRTFQEMRKAASLLSSAIEKDRDEYEEKLRSSIAEIFEEATALQRQGLEKEIEGATSLRYLEQVDNLLDSILGWYRDLHLLTVRGDPKQLIHRNSLSFLTLFLNQKPLISLEEVQKKISEVRHAIIRSSSLTTSLEVLFLNLSFIE